MRRAEMSFLQLLDEGFGWILSQAATGIEKSTEMRSWQPGGCNKAVKVTAIPERGCDFQNHRSVRARPLFLPNGGLLMWQRAKHYIRSAGAPLASKSSFSHWGCCQPRKSAPRPRRGSKFFLCFSPSMALTILKFATPLVRAHGGLQNFDPRCGFVAGCENSSPGSCQNRYFDWRHPKHAASISRCICRESSARMRFFENAFPR